jgi:hypothetical protein
VTIAFGAVMALLGGPAGTGRWNWSNASSKQSVEVIKLAAGIARRAIIGLALAATLIATLAACASTSEPPLTQTPVPTESAIPAATVPAAQTGDAGEVRVVLASGDLAVGGNRFAFGVLDGDSRPIRVPAAGATFMFLDVNPAEVRAQARARFIDWPSGRAGVYVIDSVPFDRSGRWGLIVEVTTEDGADHVGQVGFIVNEESSSPSVGTAAPRSVNRTSADVPDMADLTTAASPDLDLYQMTIADAVTSGKPTVITFATPAFCQSATCGPQVDVISAIKDRHKGEANFIHIEVYDNPKEMEGDISKGRLSPILTEWGLQSEPFTFVIDSDGLVAANLQGFVTEDEVQAALGAVLGP